MCTILNNFYYGLPLDASGKIYTNIVLNTPPQHGKTRTLVNFTDWVLGKNQEERIITGSYNDETASDFSKFARDGITQDKNDPDDIVFADIFPGVKIKRGSASFTKWALEGQHFNYLGAGMGGSVTSKGATIQIVDDLIKGAKEALNANYLDDAWLWYTSTFLSRISAEADRLLRIVCMTRWHKKDVCGRLLKAMPGEWFILKLEAYDPEKDEMLCPDFLDKKTYEDIKRLMMPEIFRANYHQEPIDIKGRLYKKFKTYTKLPADENGFVLFSKIRAYCDTADTGDDFLCNVIFGVYEGRAYVLDVYYTKEGMEVTEPETAKRLNEFNVNVADIESNSGGRGFARAVQRILWEVHKTRKVNVHWFHQSKNKKSRILSESANVQENVLFPVDWQQRWPEFYSAVSDYQKEGKNAHDDAPDTLTGVVEWMDKNLIEVLK